MRNVFTIEDIKKSKVAKLNEHLFAEKPKRKPRKVSKHVEWMKEALQEWCNENGYTLLIEHKFSEYRKFRFDFAIKELMIGIEYHGLNSEKSGHTTLLGFTKDQDKANLAQREGWNVYAYTVINFRNVVNDLNEIK